MIKTLLIKSFSLFAKVCFLLDYLLNVCGGLFHSDSSVSMVIVVSIFLSALLVVGAWAFLLALLVVGAWVSCRPC